MSRDCPEKRKPKCHNCGGPHTLDQCTSESWDTDRIFENKRIEREHYAKRNKSEPEPVKPLASVILKLTDLKGTAASIETYDQVLDDVPEPLSTVYISPTEGFRLGYGSDIEAEGAEGKAKNIVMGLPTVKIVTQRVRETAAVSPATSTPRRSSGGTEPGSLPSTPVAELFPTPPESLEAERHMTTTLPAPWMNDLTALEHRVNSNINEVKEEQVQLKKSVEGVRDTQKADSSMLRLMSIRMGLADPDPDNPIEVRAAAMARGTTCPIAPPATPTATPVDDGTEAMEHSDDRTQKQRQSEPTVDTRWIILGPGYGEHNLAYQEYLGVYG